MSWTIWILLGGLAGALAVGCGAFGAHALRERLDASELAIFEIGARYHMYHALALLACGFLALRVDGTAVRIAGMAFVLGILLFSGSLYAMALGAPRWLGAITPIGGVGFIVGWLALAYVGFRSATL